MSKFNNSYMLDFADYFKPKELEGGKSYQAYLKRRNAHFAKKRKEEEQRDLDNTAISQGEI